MKRIYIDDYLHNRLKEEAKAQGVTLKWWTEQKLSSNMGSGQLPNQQWAPSVFEEPEYVPDEQ